MIPTITQRERWAEFEAYLRGWKLKPCNLPVCIKIQYKHKQLIDDKGRIQVPLDPTTDSGAWEAIRLLELESIGTVEDAPETLYRYRPIRGNFGSWEGYATWETDPVLAVVTAWNVASIEWKRIGNKSCKKSLNQRKQSFEL